MVRKEWELKDYRGKISCPYCQRKITHKLTLFTNWDSTKWGDYWDFIRENYYHKDIVIIKDSFIKKKNNSKDYICEYCRLLYQHIYIYRYSDIWELREILKESDYIYLELLPPRLRNLINIINDWEPQLIVGFGDIFYSKILDIYVIGYNLYLDDYHKIKSNYTIYVTRKGDKINKIIEKIYK